MVCFACVKQFFLKVYYFIKEFITKTYLHYTNHQTAPGTAERPILYSSEANVLSKKNYLQNWQPEGIILPATPDFTVEKNTQYSTIQSAVNAALSSNKSTRQYIYIKPGTYNETVFVPKTGVPITLYGDSEAKVKITLPLSANMTLNEWVAKINPNNSRYKTGDPAWDIYESCVKHAVQNGTIGTQCSTVVWGQNENFQISNATIQNTATGAQAVALSLTGDKAELANISLLGFQDTLYLGGNKNRMILNKAYITGYTDFVFGAASTVLTASVLKIVTGHGDSGVIFAPNTAANQAYGFLVRNSLISGDANIKQAHLGRGWDTNLINGKYVPGVSDNGQVLITDTKISSVIDVSSPWRASTSNRKFAGNISESRNLNDNNYNRMWEYANTGEGS